MFFLISINLLMLHMPKYFVPVTTRVCGVKGAWE